MSTDKVRNGAKETLRLLTTLTSPMPLSESLRVSQETILLLCNVIDMKDARIAALKGELQ